VADGARFHQRLDEGTARRPAILRLFAQGPSDYRPLFRREHRQIRLLEEVAGHDLGRASFEWQAAVA
jgi:hypothetical protein